MKRQETLKMYGEWFEVKRPRDGVEPAYPSKWDCANIFQAYSKPSVYKIQIWEYWENFGIPYDESEPYVVGVPFISGYNCFTFSITANVYYKNNEFAGIMHITKDHNYLYLNEK